MSRDINPFGLRMPPELKARLEKSAEELGLSLNAEIVRRLEQTFPVSVEQELLESRMQQLNSLQAIHRNVIRDLAMYQARREAKDFKPYGPEWLDELIRNQQLAAARHEELIFRTQADIEMLRQMTAEPEPAKGSNKRGVRAQKSKARAS